MGCMCGDCQYTKICQDENGDLLAVCANRKSDNFLNELEIGFDNCEVGMIDDEEGE